MLRSLCCAAALAAATVLPLRAQVEVPSLRWRTIETAHFRIHYEPQLEAWARQVATRIESVRTAVAARVGYSYPHTIDIVVEDPLNVSNGSAWPSLTGPAMRFWATPPSPTSAIGSSRGWGEILSVHEYAHLAHLLRPSRQAFSLPLAITSIVPVGPLVLVPAWVTEGYATVIEGELTGSGRPNGAFRPAIIRSLALEGYLPPYASLDDAGRFNGGAMRYLIGSAYLEWLQAQRGDSSLPQLWRRVTAKTERKFPLAFSETFGDAPDVLYGRFSAEVTRRAFAAREQLERAGLAQGTLVQQWNWNVGSPDVSPNGERLVVRRGAPGAGNAIALYSLRPDTAAVRRDSVATAKRLKKDPEDVAAYRAYPRPLRRLATLSPAGGAPYDAPRFLPDGIRVLVTRSVPLVDGRMRQDLFEWNTKTGRVRRLSRGAGIVLADPTPDGKRAIAMSCGAGSCSLLQVELATGRLAMVAEGRVDASYAGARVSPDGRRVATARQEGSRWVPVVIDLATRAAQVVGPADAASRYSPSWENDSTLLVMSEASGGIEIERLPLHGGERSSAVRTLGAASAPEVGPDGRIWWLDLHGRGWNLRVNEAGSALPLAAPLDPAQFPATQRVATTLAQDFAAADVPAPRRYGAGPFGVAFLGLSAGGADGELWAAGASFGDPVGRGTGLLYAGTGSAGSWSGARAAYAWRGFRPTVHLQGFTAEYLPSERPSKVGLGWENYDRRFTGAMLALDLSSSATYGTFTSRLGGSLGTSENPTLGGPRRDRSMYFAQIGSTFRFTPRPTRSISGHWQVTAALGNSDGSDWERNTLDARLALEEEDGGVALRVRGGEVNEDAPISELFFVGGTASPYIDEILLSNRIEHLGLPFGVTGGRRFGMLTAETTGPLRFYHDWIVGGDEGFGETLRVVGGEFVFDVPRITVMRVPLSRVRAGLNHSLNGPVRNATQAYVSLSVTP